MFQLKESWSGYCLLTYRVLYVVWYVLQYGHGPQYLYRRGNGQLDLYSTLMCISVYFLFPFSVSFIVIIRLGQRVHREVENENEKPKSPTGLKITPLRLFGTKQR